MARHNRKDAAGKFRDKDDFRYNRPKQPDAPQNSAWLESTRELLRQGLERANRLDQENREKGKCQHEQA